MSLSAKKTIIKKTEEFIDTPSGLLKKTIIVERVPEGMMPKPEAKRCFFCKEKKAKTTEIVDKVRTCAACTRGPLLRSIQVVNCVCNTCHLEDQRNPNVGPIDMSNDDGIVSDWMPLVLQVTNPANYQQELLYCREHMYTVIRGFKEKRAKISKKNGHFVDVERENKELGKVEIPDWILSLATFYRTRKSVIIDVDFTEKKN